MNVLERLFGRDAHVLSDTNLRILMVTALVVPLGSGIISPILDQLTGELGVSAVRIGLIVSAFSAPGIVFIPIVGALSDRYGRKNVLVAGTALFGVAGMAIALTANFEVVVALRFVQGIGFSGIAPVIITSIGDIYTGTREDTAQGLRLSITAGAMVVFPTLGGALVAFDWRYPFLLYGVTLPVAVGIYAWFEEPTSTGASNPTRVERHASTRYLLDLATRRHVLAVLLGRSLPSFLWFAFLTYSSVHVVRLLGGTAAVAGLVVATASLVFAVTASQTGRITDAFGGRFRPLVLAQCCLGVGFVAFAFGGSMPASVGGLLFAGFGYGYSTSAYRSVITNLAPEETRAGLVGLGESLGRVTATLAPVAFGAMIGIGTPMVGFELALRGTFALSAAVVGTAGVLCLLVAWSTGRM